MTMGGIEGIGDAVTGGLVAGAVEPAHGHVASDGHSSETHCLNCGAALIGAYCHHCGQHAHVHRTLRAFGHDFMTGVLNFEGKILRTLPLLAWKPGDLTRRYIEGQRARFVSPLALFLFAVFLFFAVVQSIGDLSNIGTITDGTGTVYKSTEEALAAGEKKIASLKVARAAADAERQAEIDAQIEEQQIEVDTLRKIKEQGIGNAILAHPDTDKASIDTDIPFLDQAIKRARANPQLAIFKLQEATSKFAWALIPISVPFVWLLFPFSRRFRLYDHTVFVTYSLSFMLLLVTAISLWGASGLGGVAIAAVFIPPFHMYRQLKGAYGLGRTSALIRTFLLLILAAIAFSLFLVLVALLGVAG